MDQLYVLEAVVLRIETLYTRLAAESLLNPHDLELWRRMRRCEARPLSMKSLRPTRDRLRRSQELKGLLPLSELKGEIDALRPGSLGVQLHERSSGKRAEVRDVRYGSPAWLYDLKAGDQINSVDGRRLGYEGQLREQVALYPVGESISLKRTRRGVRELLIHVPVIGAPLSPPPPKTGDQVPPLPLEPIYEGESLDYLFTGGRPSLLFFWATWCKDCLKAAPQVARWAKRHDLQVFGITSEDPNLVRALMPTNTFSFPVLHDPGLEASRLFHVDLQRVQAPVFVYLDVERRLIEQSIGLGDEGPAQIEALFSDP
jgi:thiol-disulfide isomerase/thioredoxin